MALKLDQSTLQAALVGYQHQLQLIEQKMADLRRQLGGAAPKAASPAVKRSGRPKRHRMSPEGRARIAAAQRARWAKAKKAKKAAATE